MVVVFLIILRLQLDTMKFFKSCLHIIFHECDCAKQKINISYNNSISVVPVTVNKFTVNKCCLL